MTVFVSHLTWGFVGATWNTSCLQCSVGCRESQPDCKISCCSLHQKFIICGDCRGLMVTKWNGWTKLRARDIDRENTLLVWWKSREILWWKMCVRLRVVQDWFVYAGHGVWDDCKETDWEAQTAFVEMCRHGRDGVDQRRALARWKRQLFVHSVISYSAWCFLQ